MMTVTHMLLLRPPAYQEFIQTKNMLKWARNLVLLLGLVYGGFGIIANYGFIMEFESALLRNLLVPLLFIGFGIFTAWLTRLGLGLLLWAGAKGFGGPGKLSDVSRMGAVALVPGVLAVPLLTNALHGMPAYLLAGAGVVWMYLSCVHILEVTQQFAKFHAAGTAAAVFIFFASVFYMFMP
ncbi:hypothetical protein [Alkalicoccus halolimnae]|uniref:Yip1 domain-containing protein n=1 Tax=Alkalicoccus halolimnae TaxID=1667239 RepID=A0A5C7FBU3_9BACI|nr:hypothetical protein [Alkalicoccus halolimnae]TXF86910.1 hypothetical protein FTX54_03010 [Alkalicoccus halolimnae]